MNKIKLNILGLGSRTTSFYLSELNRMYQLKNGGYATCPFILLNTDFHPINSLLPYTSVQLDNVVSKYIHKLEKLDGDYLIIPNITLHETIDRLSVSKKVVHPVHLSIEKTQAIGWKKIVLFASLFTMKSDYIKKQFNNKGIEVIIPDEKDMIFIDEIRKQIYSATETFESIQKYHEIVKKYTQISPVVVSCTELSILKQKDNNLLLDMAEIQISQAIKYMVHQSTD